MSEKNKKLNSIKHKSDDRFVQYLQRELTQSPRQYFRQVRGYWVTGLALNLIGVVYMFLAIANTLETNAESTLNLVRVDGVRVQEAFDVRRNVLMRNSLKRAQLRGQESEDK